MINALLKGIISLIIGLVSVVLAPIDLLIASALPGVSDALTRIGAMFNLGSSYIGWIMGLTGLTSHSISLLILYYGFVLTVPLAIYTVKLALAWYDKLKP